MLTIVYVQLRLWVRVEAACKRDVLFSCAAFCVFVRGCLLVNTCQGCDFFLFYFHPPPPSGVHIRGQKKKNNF